MSRDANTELGTLYTQVATGRQDLAAKDGLNVHTRRNGGELRSRALGFLGAAMVMALIAGQMAGQFALVAAGCAVVGLALGAYAWLQRRRINHIQTEQLRDFARTNSQEDKDA